MEWKILQRDHNVYASLVLALVKSKDNPKDCIACVIGASSTDRDPEESVVNILFPIYKYLWRGSYWLSKGQECSSLPVICITLQRIGPIGSLEVPCTPQRLCDFECLKSIRKNGIDFWHLPLQQPAEDKFSWSYISPEFPMTQENNLQHFKLPEPVLCIGGCLQTEQLGRAQMKLIFYSICGRQKIRTAATEI
ncbi:Hypothetical predicted protein [Olea europaea subsp. europaea]|uniref:Uncharacterized protein n=1 Tax=Olea europaea subsp. europaea TaxID=158383 RepID=A0A8S0Q7J4_OLEEU|nr:Hypothetical predicted protein [Olea europaea subsp. europaea]